MTRRKKPDTPERQWLAFLDWLVWRWYALHFRSVQFLQRRPHRSFRRTRRRDYRRSLRLPSYISFTSYVNCTLLKRKRLFLSLAVLCASMMIFLGTITNQSTYDSIGKLMSESIGKVFDGGVNNLLNAGLLAFSSLAIDTSSLRAEQGVILALLILLVWLTTVWLLRELLLGFKPKLRDGLYNAGAPLISTLVILVVLLIQLSPIGIMAIIYSALVSVHILTEGFGMMLFGLLAASVIVLVLYWITSTIVALVVVALPGMYPMRAIHAASDLVVGRRLRIMLRLIWAFVYSSIIWCFVMISIVLLERWLSSKLKWLESVPVVPFAGAFMMALLFVWLAAYIYLLYRKVVADDAKPA
ncbi:MAG: hypothetical protein HXK98_02380 [Candidatus Nanogingivalaceae bacterium]|nr:hypothetical protein [Candidatus Nanogingivalaceae bacterium]